jgi:hypothetical protein
MIAEECYSDLEQEETVSIGNWNGAFSCYVCHYKNVASVI